MRFIFAYQTVGFMNDSKEHILLTSLQLFLQKNFKEVTMKEIVDKTGLSKGAFYHYFRSKEQVFEEVINHFFMDIMMDDYGKYSQTSLKDFYTGVVDQLDKNTAKLTKLIAGKDGESKLNTNIYYLIFDAMKMLPDFKKRNLKQQKEEFSAWKKIIATAFESKEIATDLGYEQVAKLFIYLNDGANINMIMGQPKSELKQVWDSLYSTLKAK
jgi:TetR/AcrR family transcriptional repressor of nem operon